MLQTDIGAYLEPGFSVGPQLAAAGAINGTGVDRLNVASGQVYMYYSCMLLLIVGVTAGTPTSFTVDAKIQDSADNTTFADYKPHGTNVASVPTQTPATLVARANANLTTARRYVLAVVTRAFVGGTTPTAGVASAIVFGGADRVATP